MVLLADALGYAARGWSIVPMRFPGGKKRPAVRWKRYQQKRAAEYPPRKSVV